MNFIAELNCITKKFMEDYPLSKFPELMYKQNRPYNCLLIDLHYDYLICIPYRSNIKHNNAFLFKKSSRSQKTRSGLDYSKMLIIKDGAYLNSKNVIIDQDEYKETMHNIKRIATEAVTYLNGYISYMNKSKLLDVNQFNRRYKFSTLQYFHSLLKLYLK